MPERGLHGEAEALAVLEEALGGSPADQTELVLLADSTDVTRYANSEIQSPRHADCEIDRLLNGGEAERIRDSPRLSIYLYSSGMQAWKALQVFSELSTYLTINRLAHAAGRAKSNRWQIQQPCRLTTSA